MLRLEASPFLAGMSITVARSRTRVLADQLTAVERSRLGPTAGTLTWEELIAVDTAVQAVLGLTR